MSVPYIAPAMLHRIMEPAVLSPVASLRASATLFSAMGRDFDARFCTDMANDCVAMNGLGGSLYRNWADQQAERVRSFMPEVGRS